MQRVLLSYNRNESQASVRALRLELTKHPFEFSFGADALLSAGESPAAQLERELTRFSAFVVIVGPLGLDPDRPVEMQALRIARRLGLTSLVVLVDEAALPPELADLPRIAAPIGSDPAQVCDSIVSLIQADGPDESSAAASDADAFELSQPDEEFEELHSFDALMDFSEGSAGEPDEPGELEDLAGESAFAIASIRTEEAPAEVAFSAYLPAKTVSSRRQSLLVYAHLSDDTQIEQEIESDTRRFLDEMGETVPQVRRSRESVQLRPDTPVTVWPECNDLEFDPPELTKRWRGDWTRFIFDVRARNAAALSGELALVRVGVLVAGIEIAHINCATEFCRSENPLAIARDLQRYQSRPYQRIFLSYSHRDWQITRSYNAVQLAMGNEVFQDSVSIRSGENWQAALARGIDHADIMQLFWSANSARSANVRDEWDYALKHRCPTDRCANFIRPVYWKEPPPPPPAELAHLHFRMVRFP